MLSIALSSFSHFWTFLSKFVASGTMKPSDPEKFSTALITMDLSIADFDFLIFSVAVHSTSLSTFGAPASCTSVTSSKTSSSLENK